ncbi:MAG: glycosyltransferase family 4 protein [Candidatus Kerfeldbacteria bacterium]|nr:glycosyltransferase family 4 protein [Candidatus Kerfeldbacteria bacterium]
MGQVQLSSPRVVYISTYIPRKCGIATFTKDLTNAINLLNPEHLAEVIALDSPEVEGLTYPWEVRHRIRQHEWSDYDLVLRYLNRSNVDLVVVQHEFGIWGGTDGELIVRFLGKLKKPCVVVFHTVLSTPTTHQREIMNYLCQRASVVVVMLRAAADLLRREYGVDSNKVAVIHHGVPDFPRQYPDVAKPQLKLEGRIVMSSINLLSESKGIEYAIAALPPVVEKYPNFLYLVVGETHPNIRRQEGERYRVKLQRLVQELKLQSSVQFIDRYLPLDELVRYIQASDYYITPYLNPEQAASGSLAYAVGAGKVCISTPYFYAREMLRNGRGILVPFRSSSVLGQALLGLLEQVEKRRLIEQRAYAQGRLMTWHRVALSYLELFTTVLAQLPSSPVSLVVPPTLDYVRKLTTRWGILEHGAFRVPRESEGYTVDDNAKALIVALCRGDRFLVRRYLIFILQAEQNGLLYNDRSATGDWQGEPGAGDWWGKAFWSVSCLVAIRPSTLLYKRSIQLLVKMYPHLFSLSSPRTISYALLGLCVLDAHQVALPGPENNVRATIDDMAKKLTTMFTSVAGNNWRWFENYLTYDNARLPQALLAAARVGGGGDAHAVGQQSLDWLIHELFDQERGCFSFVGCNGWYYRGKPKAMFDQQPVEADAVVEACIAAYRVTKDEKYRNQAAKAFAWYDGDNILHQSLIDGRSGGIFDGLTPSGRNKNQGAESVLSHHLAFFSLQSVSAPAITYISSRLW